MDKMEISSQINWTFISSFTLFLITVMTTVIKIYGPRATISEEALRNSAFLKKINSDISSLFEKLNKSNTESEVKKVEFENIKKTIDEMKNDHKKVGARLDNLLEKFVNYMDD